MRSRALIVALLLLAGSARAQSEKERARLLLREGLALVEARDWEKAIERFWAAYRAFPSPKILINIGATYLELDRPVDALDAYEKFLRDAPADIGEDAAAAARAGAAKATALIGEIAVEAPAGTDVALDNLPAGRTPLNALRARAGPHKVTLAVPGRGTFDVLAEVLAQARIVVQPPAEVEPAAQPPPAPTASPPPVESRPVAVAFPPPAAGDPPAVRNDLAVASAPPAAPAADEPFYARWPFWTGVAVVVVGAVVAGVVLTRDASAQPGAFAGDDYVIDTRGSP